MCVSVFLHSNTTNSFVMKMLQRFRTLAGKNNFKWTTFRHFLTTAEDVQTKEPETNFVKLIGSAWDDSIHLPTGDQLCKVVQRCYNEHGQKFSISHMLMLSKKVLDSNGIKSLQRGQAFNINGYVRSIPFETAHRKIRNAISIVPHDIQLYGDGEKPEQDVCIVMMTANIESRIWKTQNFLMFNLGTHVPVRCEETGFTGETNEWSHSVIVQDTYLQNYIPIHFNRGDAIFVEGYLNYTDCVTSDGKTRMCGNIMAVHVEKIK